MAHEALDRLIGPFDSAQSYSRYLQGMAVFRSVVEDMLSLVHWPMAFSAWQNERLADLIGQDLADIGAAAQRPSIPSAPSSSLEAEDILGMLYVLEGSALGARLLYKRAQALGYSATFGARHLAVQCRQNGRWSAYLKLLEDAVGIDIDHVAKVSARTFEIAEMAFERTLHERA
ncbi:hypothetical protein AX760_08230 [Pararhizobium antarcticum]|uniref:Heme oxygenase n=2 Tax=Pararhizobium antarcticum TaxID=1798805 RepID=A0A657LKR4_9HYPH|nr:hypothetical protein AX760_08230 [Pararhizobium antarcticum]OJF98662.1 hypothetical protein AX761_02815 [Rhizobium sp. 58]